MAGVSEVTVFEAVQNGDIDALNSIFKQSANSLKAKDGRGYRAAHIACENGRSNVIQFLARNNLPLEEESQTGYYPIHIACEHGYLDCVLALKMAKSKLNIKTQPDEQNGVHIASRHGHIEIMQLLLNNGVPGNDKDKFGNTPIAYAASNGHAEAVKFLSTTLKIPEPSVKDIKHADNKRVTDKEKAEKAKKEKMEQYKQIKNKEAKDKQSFLDITRQE